MEVDMPLCHLAPLKANDDLACRWVLTSVAAPTDRSSAAAGIARIR
jgi:hypothetical protein